MDSFNKYLTLSDNKITIQTPCDNLNNIENKSIIFIPLVKSYEFMKDKDTIFNILYHLFNYIQRLETQFNYELESGKTCEISNSNLDNVSSDIKLTNLKLSNSTADNIQRFNTVDISNSRYIGNINYIKFLKVKDSSLFMAKASKSAQLDNTDISYIECENLFADKSEMKDVYANKCNRLKDCIIGELNTNIIENIENTKIQKLLTNSKLITIPKGIEINEVVFNKEFGTVQFETSTRNSPPIKVVNGTIKYNDKGFDNVAGMEELKQTLRDDVIEPLNNPQKYKEYGLEPINGILLFGPPGCGKTFIAKMLAEETNRHFVEINPKDDGSIYMHKTASNIAKKFNYAILNSPSIIFIDEADAIAPAREHLSKDNPDYIENVSTILTELDNIGSKNVFVIFATNEPQNIDRAIKRTGRIDKKIYVGPPDIITRRELFLNYLNKTNKKENNINLDEILKLTDNYTAKDIALLTRESLLLAMKKDELVSEKHFKTILDSGIVKASLTESDIKHYKGKENTNE